MNFLDKIEETIFDWVLAALGCVLAALGCLLGYLFRYKTTVDNLKTQVEELRRARDRLQHDVDTAIRNLMKIEADVERRLTESDDIIAGAEKILEDDNKGWYLNMMFRYQVSKRADKAASEAKNLKDEISKINGVGYRESTQVVETVTSNRGYEAFESRKPTITGVLEALKDPDITRIGIHGMGGVGKTMLVKEVLKQAEKDKLFDKYLFLVVSNDPDLKRIQREIAEQLDLKLDVESELVRRDQLRKRLKQENRVLIILDDIWKYLDLEALGIFSCGDDNKGCKLLLTSGFYNVVCNDMDTQKQFEVKVFLNDEARNLFEKIVGDLAKTSEIKLTMLQIVEECAGLPIAITTVANALKNKKNPRIWKDFLNQLKMSSPREIEGMNEKVYKSIKMSYEFLQSNEAKSLLLLCSLHGEDYDIKVEDLLRYGVGLGLFDNVDTIEGARCRVHSLVERLKGSSLLLDGNYNGRVKMHDVIRDVVINIAAEERHMYTIRTVNELQTRSKRKDTVAISLPYINGDLDLPNQFECSKLELLLLFYQRVDFRIPDSFFGGLKDLKVLKLSRTWSGVLPSSLSSLENLQTLCLEGEVQNAIIIGELKNLKALSLSSYDTERLPKEIGQLTHLQLLDLRGCSKLKFIPPNVLSNLKRLEELYLPDDVEWEVEVQSTEKINAMFSELDHLSHLTKLHICIKNAKILPKAMVFERLESYRIAIGSAWLRNETSETPRILKLNIILESDYGYKVLLRKCESLFLGKMKGVKNILYELDSEGFPCLKHLKVEENDEIQYIIKSMGVRGVFPILESINLLYVNNLERISYTRLPTESFCNLRVVKVSNCRKLEFVFSSSMVGCFSHLLEMNIEDCKIMSAIVAIEREEEIEVNSDDSIMFANLHSLKLRKLFKLIGFLSIVNSHVLFNGKVVFPNLEELEIEGMDSMMMIWPNQLISDCFGKLETMTVSGCRNLTYIVPPNMLRTLQNLKVLNIYDCDFLEEVFEIQGTNNVEESCDIAAAELISLTLRNLKNVKHIWSMDPQGIITFAKLCTIEIKRCWSLKSVFPTSVAKAFLQLERLTIWDCATVEETVAKEEGIEATTLFVFPKLTTLRLHNLPDLKSLYPERHTSEWPSLKSLDIKKCNKLKIFGSNKSSMQETNGLGHYTSLIQQPLFFIEKVEVRP
uniref:AAA+ ATPase domain-containing protein n=1 Tax=Quercus lobata TaxID=97700 RepID=A0A7N2L6W3_QUELO